jgi:hypothetical protein
MLSLETHHYDGIIGSVYRDIEKKEVLRDLPTFEQALTMIEQWNSTLPTTPISGSVIRTIQLFKDDPSGNHDPVNQIRVEDLLPKVVKIVQGFDQSGVNLFLQTLSEIVDLGACPQGRITRLLGFYIPFV